MRSRDPRAALVSQTVHTAPSSTFGWVTRMTNLFLGHRLGLGLIGRQTPLVANPRTARLVISNSRPASWLVATHGAFQASLPRGPLIVDVLSRTATAALPQTGDVRT